LSEPEEIEPLAGGPKIPRRMTVDEISFSAHVDYTQNSKFIDDVMPTHLVSFSLVISVDHHLLFQVLVHGEQNNMNRLRGALKETYSKRKEDIQIHTPKNIETLRLSFKVETIAKVIFLEQSLEEFTLIEF
jgi:cleavage and polyadenylation specificity factor subunit 3